MHNIVLTEKPTWQLSEQLDLYAESIENVYVVSPDRKDLEQLLEIADALVVRLFPITEEVISLAAQLRVIGRHGVGMDTVEGRNSQEDTGRIHPASKFRFRCRTRNYAHAFCYAPSSGSG